MKNFTQRTITGFLYVAVIIACVILHPLAFLTLFIFVIAAGLNEFYNLVTSESIRPQKYAGITAALILFVSTFFHAYGKVSILIPATSALLTSLIFFIELFNRKDHHVANLSITFFGIIYVSVPISLLSFMCFPVKMNSGYTYEIVLGYFILLWLFDTGAYLIGSLVGRHKIMENVSPGKTWEGFFGGLVISSGTALIIANIFPSLTMADWLIITLITASAGTLGDLIESAFKRNAGIKDSGRLLPGHGGMLDRIDSVLLSVPFVFIFLMLRQYI